MGVLLAVATAATLTVLLSPKLGMLDLSNSLWRGYRRDTSALSRTWEAHYAARTRASGLATALERAEARELAPHTAAAGLSVRVTAGVPDAVVQKVADRARAEVRALGVAEARHPVVVIAVAESDGPRARYSRAIVLPDAADGPCTVVVRIPQKQFKSFSVAAVDRLLGTCAFHARFGAPGAATNAWLRETQVSRAAYLTPPASRGEDTAMVSAGRWPLALALPLRGCRAARPALCAEVLNPREAFDWEESLSSRDRAVRERRRSAHVHADVAVFGATWLVNEREGVMHGVLAGMASSLGPERFERIWRGAGPVAGFEQSEGRPATAWAAEYIGRRVLPTDVGPGLNLRIALVTLLLSGVATALAVRLTARRMD